MGTINDLNTTNALQDDDKFVIWKRQSGATRAITAIDMAAYFGAELAGEYQPLDATLTMYAALNMQDNKVVVGTGVDTAELVDYGTFVAASVDEEDPAIIVTRNYPGTTTTKVATALFQNLTNTASGNNYQSEVNVQLKAGTTQNFRRYFQWLNYDDSTAYFFGVNAENTVIFFDQSVGNHWIWKIPGDAPNRAGDLFLNATGTTGRFRIGLHALSADTPPPTHLTMYRGGVPVADNHAVFDFNASTGFFTKYSHLDGTTVEFIMEPGGQFGAGKANPAYGVDIERTDGLPFRAVWQTGSITVNTNNFAYTTTTATPGDQMVITDADNASTRAALRVIGNGGAVETLFAASNGNVGINTTNPGFKLDVEGAIKFTPGASVTPPDNGDVVIEFTNNTTLTFKGKGSDGVVRTATLTLA